MDGDAVRKKRLEEIETKRKRLEEMKKSRGAAAVPGSAPAAAAPTSVPINPILDKTAHQYPDVDNNESKPLVAVERDPDALVSSILSSISVQTKLNNTVKSSESSGKSSAERSKCFGTMRVGTAIHIPPSVPVLYDKGCQTEDDSEANTVLGEHTEATILEHQTPRKGLMRRTASSSSGVAIVSNSSHHIQVDNMTDNIGFQLNRQLSEVDKSLILADPAFSRFLKDASLHIERALEFSSQFDILKDYTVDSKNRNSSKSVVFDVMDGYEEESVVGRPVMDITWSTLLPELFLVAYGSKFNNLSIATSRLTNASAPPLQEEDMAGLVCVWSKELHKRPEFKFTAVSPVLTATFHPNEPNLIIGGCYNGQIILWDMKSSKSSPIQRSSLTGKGHKHPVYCMGFSGSSLSNELISISVDGQLCYWDVSRLTEPINVVFISFPGMPRADFASQLQSPVGDKMALSQPLNVCCMDVSHSDSSPLLIVGSGAGQLIRANLPYKPLDPKIQQADAHFGLVTSVQLHPNHSNKYKHLFLTCSLDWTIKLFSAHDVAEPILEFVSPTCDYVCDVQWSPVHPAVFVTITSTGKVGLWNLSKSTTEPVDTISLLNADDLSHGNSYSGKTGGRTSAIALNKAIWMKDGQQILVGDSAGTVYRIKVQSSYAISSQGDENKFELVLLAPKRSSSFRDDSVGGNDGASGTGFIEHDDI